MSSASGAGIKKCCIPECNVNSLFKIPLHLFPNPDRCPEKFLEWVNAIGGDIVALDPQYIYKNRRVCHQHFESKFYTWSNRLSYNAVPTLFCTGRPSDQETANLLPPPEKLDLDGDNATVALRWERWKRSFNLYLEATGITGDEKKRATLLLVGGSGLQDIVYNLPGAHIEASGNINIFKTVIEKLDEYFLPKQNKIYERHIFRQIKQEEGETFEKFLVRLRCQAAKCKFTNSEEHLIDQIVEKCSSSDLRIKILTLGDDVTLNKIINVATTMEIVG